MNQPTSGGQYVRDPKTGDLTKVTDAPVQEPVVITETGTETPVVKTASEKGNRNG